MRRTMLLALVCLMGAMHLAGQGYVANPLSGLADAVVEGDRLKMQIRNQQMQEEAFRTRQAMDQQRLQMQDIQNRMDLLKTADPVHDGMVAIPGQGTVKADPSRTISHTDSQGITTQWQLFGPDDKRRLRSIDADPQLRASNPGNTELLAPPPAQQKLMFFGGAGHHTYLGCLNCPSYAEDSIFNSSGTHGNPNSTVSILNRFSDFGSAYSDYSACNPYASDPPVIVDALGGFSGRLTVNQFAPERLQHEGVNTALTAFCAR